MKYKHSHVRYLREGMTLSERFFSVVMAKQVFGKVCPDWMVQVMWEDFNRFDEWITPVYVLTYRKVYVPVFKRCGPVIAQALNEGYHKDLNEWTCRCC